MPAGRPKKLRDICEAPKSFSHAVMQVEGERILNIFASITEASKKTGIHKGCISRACKMQGYTAGGYCWEYVV